MSNLKPALLRMASSRTVIDMTFGTDYTASSIQYIQVCGSAGGDVSVLTFGGDTIVYEGIPPGTYLNVRVKQVNSSGTTATQVIGYI